MHEEFLEVYSVFNHQNLGRIPNAKNIFFQISRRQIPNLEKPTLSKNFVAIPKWNNFRNALQNYHIFYISQAGNPLKSLKHRLC